MNYKEEWNKIGYNLEELYFEKINRELIHRIKASQNQSQGQENGQTGQVIQFRSRAVTEEMSTKKAA